MISILVWILTVCIWSAVLGILVACLLQSLKRGRQMWIFFLTLGVVGAAIAGSIAGAAINELLENS